MNTESARLIAKALTIMAMMPTVIGEAIIAKSVFDAIGRNPKLESALFSKAIIIIALVETTAIFAFVAFFTL